MTDHTDLERMQANVRQSQLDRATVAAEQAQPDAVALCGLLKPLLPLDAHEYCTPASLEMLETFRARKADPDGQFHLAWNRERVAKIVGNAVVQGQRGIVALKTPLKQNDGKPLTRSELNARETALSNLRKAFLAAQADPIFAFLRSDLSPNVFGEAQDRARWGTPPLNGDSPQQHDETTCKTALVVLGRGADTFQHMINYLDHIDQLESEMPNVRKSYYDEQKTFSRKALSSLIYAAPRTPLAGLSYADIRSGKDDLITALHSFCVEFYGIGDADTAGETKRSLGERVKDWIGKDILKEISEDFLAK